MPPVMLGNLSIPGILDFNDMSYFVHTLEGPYVFSTTLGGWKVYGFTFISLPTYGNGSVVNPTYMLQKTMVIAYNGGKVIALLYYRNLAPVSLKLNQYWSHIHKGVDGLSFTVFPSLFNPYTKATKEVIRDAYYIAGNTSLYVNGRYLGQLNSFGLWQVLPVGPITLINNAGRWNIQLIPMNNLSTTQQIQLVTNGFSINGVTIANSFFNIQHAEVTLMPDQSAQYVYSIGINTQPPNYTEISGILNYLLQIASSSNPQNTSSSSSSVQTPSLTTFTVTKTTTVTIPMTTTVTTTVAVPVTRTSTVTATTTVLSTVTSTITAATATTTATTITALGGIGVVCWILAAVLAVLLAVVILLWRRSSRTIAIEPMETQVR